MRSVRTVGVIGSGLMGSGIGQVAATAGFAVILADTNPMAIERACERIESSLNRLVYSERISEPSKTEILGRIAFTTDLHNVVAGSDLIVEAIIEELEPKQNLFELLDRECAEDVVLATNTSQFQIGSVCSKCVHKHRVIGLHFSNPPPVMKLVEVIPSNFTSSQTLKASKEFLRNCGKSVVTCQKDIPGFISNRLSTALFMEAVRLVDEKIASPQDIDDVARFMFGHRMGPMATLDLAGLDTALLTASALEAYYNDGRFAPPQTLLQLVEQGRTGRKSGQGFYKYEESSPA